MRRAGDFFLAIGRGDVAFVFPYSLIVDLQHPNNMRYTLVCLILLVTGCGSGVAPDLPRDDEDVLDVPFEPLTLMPLDEGNTWYYRTTLDPERQETLTVDGAEVVRNEEFVRVWSFNIDWTGSPFAGAYGPHYWRYTDSSLVKLDRGLGSSGFVELEYRFPGPHAEEPWLIEDLSGGPYHYYTELLDETAMFGTEDGEVELTAYRSFRRNVNLEDEIDLYWIDYFAEDIGWVKRVYDGGHSAELEHFELRQ